MPERFEARLLSEEQVDQAFPIVQSAIAGITMEAWRRFAQAMVSADRCVSGVMTAQSRGYIHGLFSYRACPSLRHQTQLLVENFIVLDLFNPSGAASALLGAMDELADDVGCEAILTTVPNSIRRASDYRRWLVGHFQECGHHEDSVMLCKHIAEWGIRDTANTNVRILERSHV